MKKTIIAIIFLLVLFIFSYFIIKQMTGHSIASYTYTKAFCNESNYCHDYEITCEQGLVTKIMSTGYAVQQPDAWNDTRNDTRNNSSLC
jgi:hypothetical protein